MTGRSPAPIDSRKKNDLPHLCPLCNCADESEFLNVDSTEIQNILNSIAERIYNGENLTSDKSLLRATAKPLRDGIANGYGKDIPGVDFETPDYNSLEALTNNVYHFSAAKNYQELTEISAAIKDGDRIRPLSEFKTIVEDISKQYNQNWLRTEYNQAIATAQTTARWNEFKKHADDMPYLKYQTIGDGNVRSEHQLLNGIVKRHDDEFWSTYYPPNGWGCRCEAVQLPHSSATETPEDKTSTPPIPAGFKTNFAQKGIVFPKSHAYYKNMPDSVWQTIDKDIRNARIKDIREEAKFLTEKTVVHPALTKPIRFSNKGIKEYLNQPHEIYMTKNEALLKMDEILQQSKYKGVLMKKSDNVLYTPHLFEIEIKGKKSWLIVKDYEKEGAWFYSISDKKSILQYITKEP